MKRDLRSPKKERRTRAEPQPYIFEFLRDVARAEKNGEYLEHAQLFVELGIYERAHLEALVRRPNAMSKVEDRLEERGVSFLAIAVLADALEKEFSDTKPES